MLIVEYWKSTRIQLLFYFILFYFTLSVFFILPSCTMWYFTMIVQGLFFESVLFYFILLGASRPRTYNRIWLRVS
jgi:hypothetical protein